MDKNRALSDWIATYPRLYGWLYFNTVLTVSDNVSLMTDNDTVIESYVDGTENREYVFAVNFMKNYDTGTSYINMIALEESQNFNKWVRSMVKADNLPDWGDLNVITDIECLTDIPLMSVDTEAEVAKYMLQLKIKYVNKENEDE